METWRQLLGAVIGVALAALVQRFWSGWGGRRHRMVATVSLGVLALGSMALGLALASGAVPDTTWKDRSVLGTFFLACGCAMAYFAVQTARSQPKS